MSNPLYNSIKLYIILIIIIIFIKPNIIYDKKINKFKSFGTRKNETLFSFHVIAIILAIIIYLFFLILDKLQNNKNINNSQQFIPMYQPIYTQYQQPIQPLPIHMQYYYTNE